MSRFCEIVFCAPLLFRRHVCLSNLKHSSSRELPLTARKTVFSHLKSTIKHQRSPVFITGTKCLCHKSVSSILKSFLDFFEEMVTLAIPQAKSLKKNNSLITFFSVYLNIQGEFSSPLTFDNNSFPKWVSANRAEIQSKRTTPASADYEEEAGKIQLKMANADLSKILFKVHLDETQTIIKCQYKVRERIPFS